MKIQQNCKTMLFLCYIFSCISYYNLSNVCLFVCLFVCSPTPPRSLGRSSPNLEGRWRAAPDISLRGSFFERSRSSRSKVKFMCFFCLFPYFSQVLGQIFTKLGGKVEGGPGSRGSFLKVKVIEVKGQVSVSRQSLVRFA